MLTAITGSSDRIDVAGALADIIHDCRAQLNGKKPQAGILFTSRLDIDHNQMLVRIVEAFPGLQLIGCTTDGEIIPQQGFLEDAISLLLLSSETVEFATSIATNLSVSAEESFARAYKNCIDQLASEPVFGITLPDGLSTAGTALDIAIQKAMGGNFPVFGGTAADSLLLTGTYQFHNNEVLQDAAPLLLFGGDVAVDAKICIGVEPIGRYYSIDKARENILYTIDGRMASEVYEELLGESAHEQRGLQFPLAIYEEGEDGFYLRDPMKTNLEDGSVSFIGNFPPKCRARFISIDREHMLKSARVASGHLFGADQTSWPELIFIFSCASRKHSLGTNAIKELSLLLEHQGKAPFFGFYCYGEIGPLKIGEPVRFHNDTFVAVGVRSTRK